MKKRLKTIWLCNCLILSIVLLCGCNKKDDSNNVAQKLDSEIRYIDNELIEVINSLNGIDYLRYEVIIEENVDKSSNSNKTSGGESSENSNSESNSSSDSSNSESNSSGNINSEDDEETINKVFKMQSNNILNNESEVDWYSLTNKIEKLYISWPTIAMDLKNVGINEKDIFSFEENLDLVALSIKNKNKNQTISMIVDLYKYLTEFVSKYEKGNKKEDVLNCKYCLLKCYKYANEEDWGLFRTSLNELDNDFLKVQSNINNYEGKKVNIDNCGVIIREMSNSDYLKEKSIFFIKYKNLMQEFDNLI